MTDEEIFNWVIALSGGALAGIMTWAIIEKFDS